MYAKSLQKGMVCLFPRVQAAIQVTGNLARWIVKQHLPFTKRQIMMRIQAISVFMFLVMMQVGATSLAQQITLQGKNVTLEYLFKEVRKQTGYTVLWQPDQLDANKTMDVHFVRTPLQDVLDRCSTSQGLSYSIKGKAIVFKKKPPLLPPHLSSTTLPLADSLTIRGKVTDSLGSPLVGASVQLIGTNQGTKTNTAGEFSLSNIPKDATLQISFIGFENKRIQISGTAPLSIALKESNALDEVVVIGYGTQKRGEITSAIASVQSKDFTTGAMRDASELIKGKVAGLAISNGSGDPTATPSVSLRGIATLQGGTTPLILINGIPGDFNTVSPQEIESVDVLKDASAAAIYGTRGANGVILITTKHVDRDIPTTLSYSPYMAVSNFYKRADFVDANQYRNLLAAGQSMPFPDEGYSTDWLDAISRTGFLQNHNLNLKGGNTQSNYVANANYIDQDGLFLKSYNRELRLTLDVNHSMFNNRLKLNLNVVKGLQTYGALGDGGSFNPEIYRQALTRNPTDRIKDDQGQWQERPVYQYLNPVAMIEEADGKVDNEWTRLTANATVTLLKDWDTKLMVATDRSNGFKGYAETKKHYSTTQNGLNGYASRAEDRKRTDYLELTTTYNRSFGEHELRALAGYSYQYNINGGGFTSNYDFPTDQYSYYNMGAGAALLDGRAEITSYQNDNRLIGFFGRVGYGYNNRYHLLASIRREGSSKFGANNKWGLFPAVSAGWTISNESFMKGNTFFDNLKLRAGYGVTGIIPTDSYLSQTALSYQNYYFNDDIWRPGLVPASNPNPNLRWEKSTEINMGLDFTLFDGKLGGSVDVYNKKTKDMLWDYTVPVPPYLYNRIKANVGKMVNKGVEVLLNGTPVRHTDFEWNTTLTFSHNANKVTSLSNNLFEVSNDYINTGNIGAPMSGRPTHRIEVGYPIGNFFGIKSVDIDDNGAWIVELPDGSLTSIVGLDFENEINRQYLGNGIPKFQGGFTNRFRYKNLDLSLVLTGAFGFQILNFQRMFYENPTIQYNMLNSAFDKVYGKTQLNFQQQYVSYYIEDGDYVKVENVTLGYNFKPNVIKFLKDARIYVSAANLYTFTGYKGLDPEINRSDILTAGNDPRDKYPSARTFTLGINVNF